MSDPPNVQAPSPLSDLRSAVLDAAAELAATAGGDADAAGGGARGPRRGAAVTLERPRQVQFGDYSTNAALVLAPALGEPPRNVAERLGESLAGRLGANLERFEVAGPGFVNLFLTDAWLRHALAGVLSAGERYGAGGAAPAQRILVEFVSANPTGPMHVGHARNAAYGDALSRILDFHGHHVAREFYVNDAGTQVVKLGESIAALARGEEVPEDGYHGEYVQRLVGLVADGPDADAAALGRSAVAAMVAQMREVLAAFGVAEFDRWPSRGAPTRATARCGCARATSATTRTACSCAPAGSTPISRPTSPTPRTSASADSSASSTYGAPTTTATSNACTPRMRRSAGTPPSSSC
jgi:arginyl-tRNA synthetase